MVYLLLIFTFISVLLSGFFAGSETGVYRLSRFRLRLHTKTHVGNRVLSGIIKDGYGLVLSLLIGNNFANYLATSLATWIFLRVTGSNARAEVFATFMMTPILFIFGEIVPKNLFYYRANSLMTALSPVIWFFYKLFTLSGAVAALKWISRSLGHFFNIRIDASQAVDLTQREQVKQIFHETREEGLVSELQKSMMNRLMKMASLPVTSVMVPLEKIQKAEITTNRQQLLEILSKCRYSRLPVYEGQPHHISGYISIYQILGSGESFEQIRPWIHPVVRISQSASVIKTIEELRKHNCPIALVYSIVNGETKEQSHLLGMVTLQDLIEELTE